MWEAKLEGDLAHDLWVRRSEKLRKDAEYEEYVKHHIFNHGGEIPIWVATGFMDFGSLIRLYSLMDKRDHKKIADEMGLGGSGAGTLHRWLRSLNILRSSARTTTASTQAKKLGNVGGMTLENTMGFPSPSGETSCCGKNASETRSSQVGSFGVAQSVTWR